MPMQRDDMDQLADTLSRAKQVVAEVTPRIVSTREEVVGKIKESYQALGDALSIATKANPLAADVPVFQKMQALAKEVSALMLEVNKLRGL